MSKFIGDELGSIRLGEKINHLATDEVEKYVWIPNPNFPETSSCAGEYRIKED